MTTIDPRRDDQHAANPASAIRRAIGVALVLAAIATAWFDFAVATPYFLARPPGPRNPAFAWYIVFHLFPYTSTLVEGVLIFAGLKLIRAWTSYAVPLVATIIVMAVLFGGGLLWSSATG